MRYTFYQFHRILPIRDHRRPYLLTNKPRYYQGNNLLRLQYIKGSQGIYFKIKTGVADRGCHRHLPGEVEDNIGFHFLYGIRYRFFISDIALKECEISLTL